MANEEKQLDNELIKTYNHVTNYLFYFQNFFLFLLKIFIIK